MNDDKSPRDKTKSHNNDKLKDEINNKMNKLDKKIDKLIKER